ncbi:HNH endonuclease [Streptomyces sp. NPDC058629]|uniref:HNH endonuclease n=1 Tax=Streptomyces sp. NPDC058629 TaxID=3346565 RepID=UPI003662121A
MTKRTCDVPECERATVGRGLCRMHYQRMRTHGTTDLPARPKATPKPCSVEGCENDHLARGLCNRHYQRMTLKDSVADPAPRSRSVCSVEDCGDLSVGRGLCVKHYGRFMRHGSTDKLVRQRTVCSVEACDRFTKAEGLCELHLRRARKGTDLLAPKRTPRQGCDAEGCDQPHHCRGLCKRHYHERYTTPKSAQYEQARRERVAAMSPQEKAALREERRRYYQMNRKRIREQRKDAYVRQYAEDPAPWRAAKSRRRMRLGQQISREDARISTDYRRAIANDPCFYCGQSETHCVDHFFPLARGGTDHWWNLVRACVSCNASKHAKCGTRFMLMGGLL